EGLTRIGGGLRDVASGALDLGGTTLDILGGRQPLVPSPGMPSVGDRRALAERQMASGAQDIAGGTAQALVGAPLEIERITGAPVRGALLNPSNPFEGAVDAFRYPQQAQLRNVGGIRSL